MRHVLPKGRMIPTVNPLASNKAASRHTRRITRLRSSSQSDPHADFVPPSSHHIGNHAIEPECRKQARQESEASG
jgi:hypothetical protein